MNPRPHPYQGCALPLSYISNTNSRSPLLEIYERINKNRAENGAQTRDPQLGRLVLYRLSYFRELTTTSATVSFFCGSRWIRTTEGENQQIYSLPHLAALEYSQYLFQSSFFFEPLVGFEPTTPRLQITCSGQLS